MVTHSISPFWSYKQGRYKILGCDAAKDRVRCILRVLVITEVITICRFTRTIATARSKLECFADGIHPYKKTRTCFYTSGFDIPICEVVSMCFHVISDDVSKWQIFHVK